ncbi:MAG: cytochrome c-type biogenesis protein [Pseudomonadota bacterium]
MRGRGFLGGLRPLVVAALVLLVPAPEAGAVAPHEVLEDPALEARAREISKGLRCVVCRNESIDESNAEIAADMRRLVRERLVAGDSDAEVRAWFVARYGEFVLLEPTRTGANLILWFAGPALLLLGGAAAFAVIRRGRRAAPAAGAALSEEEAARLRRLMDGEGREG